MSGVEKAAHGRSSMFQVWVRSTSGKRRETVRFDLERKVTRRYERREIAAAIAAWWDVSLQNGSKSGNPTLPWTTACSP